MKSHRVHPSHHPINPSGLLIEFCNRCGVMVRVIGTEQTGEGNSVYMPGTKTYTTIAGAMPCGRVPSDETLSLLRKTGKTLLAVDALLHEYQGPWTGPGERCIAHEVLDNIRKAHPGLLESHEGVS